MDRVVLVIAESRATYRSFLLDLEHHYPDAERRPNQQLLIDGHLFKYIGSYAMAHGYPQGTEYMVVGRAHKRHDFIDLMMLCRAYHLLPCPIRGW